MHERKIIIRNLGELLGCLALYALVLVAVHRFGFSMPKGILKTLVLISPMVPFLLMIGAVVRAFRRVDEYLRLQMLENWAITAAVTMGLTFTYGFLENAGFPKLSMFTVCPVMGGVCAVVAIVRRMVGR